MMVQIGNHQNAEVDESMIRHMVLNSIRFNRQKFRTEFGELIICADDKNYWRRKQFPYYKAARKKSRETSELDWNAIFQALNKIRDELMEFFPYKVLRIPTVEADDIIGTIVHHEGRPLNSGEKILILSGDKDYKQLHKYGNVSQYNPTLKKWVKEKDADAFLFEHIIRGDVGDGIPNCFSSDNCLVLGEKQKSVTQNRLSKLKEDLRAFGDTVERNFYRNQALIDLTKVPNDLQTQILEEYQKENTKDRSQLFNYFIQNKLKFLMDKIQDF